MTRKGLLITLVAIFAAVGIAIGFRFTGGAPIWAAIVGALLLGPPLVWSGYSFVQDSELEPYLGTELRNRVLILSVILAALWLVYAFVPSYISDLESPSEMSFLWFGIIFCVMVGLGAVASSACFELEVGNGVIHAGLYFLVTMVLAILSGFTLATG